MRLQVALAVGIPVLLAAVAIVTWAVGRSGTEPAPEPISRSELFAEYTRLVPDPEATTDSVANLAKLTCGRLSDGVAPGDLLDAVEDTYHGRTRARQVLHLVVSYGCPDRIHQFG